MTDWRNEARCRDVDSELFFPVGETGRAAIQTEEAKAVCRACPAVEECLQYALDEDIPHGVFGGLTERERASIQRSVKRGHTAAEDAAAKAQEARQPRQEQTLKAIFEASTVRLWGGHLAWTGSELTYFGGTRYTPRQVAFAADRGHEPDGRVQADCGNQECVLPAHLADTTERARCGTTAGYRRHRTKGEAACTPCREANTAATNQRAAAAKTAA